MRHRCGRCKEQVWEQESHCSNCGADLKPGKSHVPKRPRTDYHKPSYDPKKTNPSFKAL